MKPLSGIPCGQVQLVFKAPDFVMGDTRFELLLRRKCAPSIIINGKAAQLRFMYEDMYKDHVYKQNKPL